MVTVTVMYPRTDDVSFDMDYYKEKHFGLLREVLGDKLKREEIHDVQNGPYVAYCQMYFDSMDDFGTGMAARGAEVMADVKNYTNVEPVMLISTTD